MTPPLNINDNDQFYQWILDKIENDPDAIRDFMTQGDIVSEAMEYFNNDWIAYVEDLENDSYVP